MRKDSPFTDSSEIEAWIELQLKTQWAEAEFRGHENRNGNLYFWMRSDRGDFWLIVGGRVYRTHGARELMDFLEEESWLDRLVTDRCIRVQRRGGRPTLCRPPNMLV